MPVPEKKPEEEILERVQGYGLHWSYEITEENIRENQDFLYLELEAEEDIQDEFMELGNCLEARSSGVVKDGERYVLSVEK